jgi:hypothetical protein
MLDPDIRRHRACIARDLVLLAASPEEQFEFFDRTGCPREELALQWLDWDEMMLPQVVAAGAITLEIARSCNEITEALSSFNYLVGEEITRNGHMGPHHRMYSDVSIRADPRWQHVRSLARGALRGLHDLGVITRELTDPDYGTAVIEPGP